MTEILGLHMPHLMICEQLRRSWCWQALSRQCHLQEGLGVVISLPPILSGVLAGSEQAMPLAGGLGGVISLPATHTLWDQVKVALTKGVFLVLVW